MTSSIMQRRNDAPAANGGDAMMAAPKNGTSAMQMTREMAETISAIKMARALPRNKLAAMDEIKNECARPSLAKAAMYTYARGGQVVTGPSIRLAETLAQCWGNLTLGTRATMEVGDDGKPYTNVQTYCWDMERNVRQERIFPVQHVRDNGKEVTTGRDVYEHAANQASRRLRACILGIIPSDVVEMAVDACNKTNADHNKVTPERIKKMLDAFAEFGVTKSMIEVKYQRHIEAILPQQLADLGNVYNAIRDGVGTVEDAFPKGGDTPDAPRKPARKARAAQKASEAETVQPEDADASKAAQCGEIDKPEDQPPVGGLAEPDMEQDDLDLPY